MSVEGVVQSKYGGRGRLTLKDYNALGRIKGSIEAAIERAFQAADNDARIARDRDARLALLRLGMIPWLAGINPDTGSPRRQRALLSEIPEEARPLIDLLVEERLLSTDVNQDTGGRTIEPAHEALLRQWGSLQGWLKEDFAALTNLETVKRAARDWAANAQSEDWLSHRAGRLEEAERLLQRTDLSGKLDTTDRGYLAACREREKAERKEKTAALRRRWHFSIAAALAAVILTFFGWHLYTLPETSKSWIQAIKETTSSEIQTKNLWWLALSQPLLPPYDFSGTPRFANISYPGLKLNAPNFSSVEFTSAALSNAQLPSASFNRSLINTTDFRGSKLKFAQYRDARVRATSFAGADLSRAVFDGALLCDVDFSNADLQSASFSGATLDDRTYGKLGRTTAWWVAVGWNSGHFVKLLTYSGARTSSQVLRKSDRFHTDIEVPLAKTRPGTFERAVALNDMAWTLTTWGIDREGLQTTPEPCDTKADPEDAFGAASEAICIVEDLKRRGSQFTDYDYWLSTFRDTQAYILMQADRMSEAKALYEKDIDRTESDGGSLFRYAITLYALGQENEAAKRFDAAINGKQYLPRDELQNLKRYIPLSARQMAYEVIDMAYPVRRPVQSCSAEAKPN